MIAIGPDDVFDLLADLLSYISRSEARLKALAIEASSQRLSLIARHNNAVSQLENSYAQRQRQIRAETARIIRESQGILADVERLDKRLEEVDKYYVKTKKKIEAELATRRDSIYDKSQDAFEALKELKASHKALVNKYTNDILPSLINGLHYIFSAKRKRDYEELIVLRNTVKAFIDEIGSTMPSIRDETISALRSEENREKTDLLSKQRDELDHLDTATAEIHAATIEELKAELDNLLPFELIEYFVSLEADYQECMGKVNTAETAKNGVFDISDIAMPYNALCELDQIRSFLRDKLKPLSDNEYAFFPLPMSTVATPTWYIQQSGSNDSVAQSFVHSLMFNFLVNAPIPNLEFLVVDPENRGNSIAPYFDARKKLPKLFGGAIRISQDQVRDLIDEVNEYIEDTLQNKLGNQYDNVFNYSASAEQYVPTVRLLTVFDFPRAFDERMIAGLRSILRNGRRAGVFTVIVQERPSDNIMADGVVKAMQTVINLSTVAVQTGGNLVTRGLPLTYAPMPDKMEFASYFGRYMLVYEGIKNKGIAFSALVKSLVDAKTDDEAATQIEELRNLDRDFLDSYGIAPNADSGFKDMLPLGRVSYPPDLFSESGGFNTIAQEFSLRDNGEYGIGGSVDLPLVLNLSQGFALYLTSDDNSRNGMIGFSHHVTWDFLSYVPATKAELCVFDNEQRGNSIIPFLDLKKNVPETFGDGICTGQDNMLIKLRELNSHIDNMIQDKLSNRYSNVLEYNAASPNRAERLILLVIYDFPSGMDSRSLGYLNNIIRNGGKCGVSVVICNNNDIAISKYDDTEAKIADILKLCTVVSCRDGKLKLEPFGLNVAIPDLPTTSAVNRFAQRYASVCEEIKKRGLSFKDILATELFSGNSAAGLDIPIGIGDGDSIVSLSVGKGSSHHGLIVGATGSGKSTLMHTLIMSAMLKYAPNQLQLYLMDFKGGTEFKIYETAKLPHIQLLALDAMQEFGESILEKLVSEMERRSKLFKEAGQSNLKDFVKETGGELPRILVLMDEFQILFNDATNRKVANNCAELTKRIVTEGRSFGIHLLMATQSTKVIGDLTLSRGTLEQMRIRIGMKCGEDDARYLFSDRNDRQALSMMVGPIGTAVMNPEYMESDNIGFRVAYCDDSMQAVFLKEIKKRFEGMPFRLQIFEGGRVTALAEFMHKTGAGYTDETPARINLGELIKAAPPLQITLDRRHRHNLLICGANERMSNNIVNLYMFSALLNRHVNVLCINGDFLMGDSSSNELYTVYKNHFGHRFDYAKTVDDTFRLLNRAYESYLEHRKANSQEQTILVVKDLQFLESFKKMLKGEKVEEVVANSALDAAPQETVEPNPLDPFASISIYFANKDSAASTRNASADGVSATQKLQTLIDSGSIHGVHIIVSSLEYQCVGECMRYGERVLGKFPERIVFSLGENDAYNLIDSVSISSLRDNTVYFTDGIKQTLQLKPYAMPDASEIESILGNLACKG